MTPDRRNFLAGLAAVGPEGAVYSMHKSSTRAHMVRAAGGLGVDVVFDNVGEAVFEASVKATAYDGRYLMMGFASNKEVLDEPWIVPRRIATANIKLCGVLLAYAADDMRSLVKTAMGWNFIPGERGTEIMREIVALVEQGAVHAVIGRTATFEDIPQAITDLADRGTTGRTVVLLP